MLVCTWTAWTRQSQLDMAAKGMSLQVVMRDARRGVASNSCLHACQSSLF